MIYQLLKPLVRLALHIFYRRIDVIGRENIVTAGPAIYIANHPNALIDPLIVGITVQRKVFFLAGANFFGKGFRSYLFKEHFNMIPVYRPWLAKGQAVTSNKEMFEDCFKALAAGKCIVLFPEASSETVSKIREVKSGAIRIKYGAESYTNNQMVVPIIPVGINYSNPHEFRSRIIVNIGQPVDFDKTVTADGEGLKTLTNNMKEAMENAIVRIENDDNQDLVKLVNRLYVDNLRSEEGASHKDVAANFKYLRQIAEAAAYFEQNDPETTKRLASRIRNYFNTLKEKIISDDIISESPKLKPGILRILLSVLGFPVAFIGMLLNFTPYRLTKWIFYSKFNEKINDEDEDAAFNSAFTSTLIFGSGLAIFLIWNIIVSIILGFLFHNPFIGIACLFLLFPLLRFSLFYFKITLYNLRFFRNRLFSSSHAEMIEQLKGERAALIAELSHLHERYRA